MPSFLIDLDEATFQALNHVAPVAKRQRTAFVRRVLKDAIRKHEYARIREGYRKLPDSAADADDWSTAEIFDA